MNKTIGLVTVLLLSGFTQAKENVVRLEGIKIKADNEAPQVMYIIPWQNPQGAERLYSPVTATNLQRLKPIDPNSFNLEMSLHKQWHENPKQVVDLVK